MIWCTLSFLGLIQTNLEGPWKGENECLPRVCSVSCTERDALCIWVCFIPRGQYAYCISEMIYLKLRRPFQEACNQNCPWMSETESRDRSSGRGEKMQSWICLASSLQRLIFHRRLIVSEHMEMIKIRCCFVSWSSETTGDLCKLMATKYKRLD